MAHFLMRWKFAEASVKTLVAKPHDRTDAAKALIEGFGGKLHTYYFSFGDHDGVAISEFHDHTAAAACALSAASTGAFSNFETTVLLTGKEAEAAMQKAHDTKTNYKPPHA